MKLRAAGRADACSSGSSWVVAMSRAEGIGRGTARGSRGAASVEGEGDGTEGGVVWTLEATAGRVEELS